MKEYHKIKTLWKRESKKPCKIIVGEYALPEFELLKDLEWVCTEKIDGTNIRVMWDGDKVKLGGKTERAQLPMHLLDKLNEMFLGEANEQLFEQTFDCGDVCLYGEGYGAKIQKGGGNYGEVNFVLFDVKVGEYWLQREDIQDVAKKLGIDVVPIIFKGTLDEVSEFVFYGVTSQWGDFKAEGVIAKPEVELLNRRGKRIITKLKCKDFN